MALWTLANRTCKFWHDASDSSAREIATGISRLDDKSGNALHLTQGTGSNQPPISAAAVNGLDVIQFNNSNYILSHTPATPVGQTEFWLFQVWKTGTPQTYAGMPVLLSSGSAARPLGRWQGISENQLFVGSGSTYVTLSLRTATTVFVHAIRVKKDGVNSQMHLAEEWANGVLIGSYVITSDWSNIDQVITLGKRPDGSVVFNGLFCEDALIEGSLTTDERQIIEGALGWKWGPVANFDAGHPYKSAAPTTSDNGAGGVVMPPMVISGLAVNNIPSVGNIVAQPMSVSGKVWNVAVGNIISVKPSVSGEAENTVVCAGNISIFPRISGLAENPAVAVGNVSASCPIASGVAVNNNIALGNISANCCVWGRANNPKTVEIIKYRRCNQ